MQQHLFQTRPAGPSGEPVPPVQVLSFGAGQDSTALLELWLVGEDHPKGKALRQMYPAEHLYVVFSDTGNEHRSTYEHLEATEDRLAGREDVTFIWIQPGSQYHRESWPSLEEHFAANNTIGSKGFVKACSENLKPSVIYKRLEEALAERFGFPCGRKRGLYRYKEHFGRLPVMLGIAKGEERRAKGNDTGPTWMQRCINRVYPLIELGLGRTDCQEVIRELAGEVPFPSMCRFCPFKSDRQVLLMSRRDPEGLERWMELEQNKIDAWAERTAAKGTKNHGVWTDGRLLPDVLEDARAEYGHLTTEELEADFFSHGHCVSSTY
jgi:hypothetical protein